MSMDILNVGASCITGATVIAITNPLDCLKQRWQVSRASAQYPQSQVCARSSPAEQ